MLTMVIDPRRADLGHGLLVQRILPFAKRRMVGPFIFLDHAGPVRLAAEEVRKVDVRPHPHIGLSTVSYLFSGSVTHRDSLGVKQVIVPGEVNWMTAGRGISHSERFEDPAAFAGQGLELLQSWVALPEADEETDPRFDNYPIEALPEARDGDVWMRLIAGEAYGLRSKVKTHSPLFYVHAVLQAGATFTLPRGYEERAIYIASGGIDVGGQPHVAGQMLVFDRVGDDPTLTAGAQGAVLMLLGGDAVGPRHIWWNFVSSRKERIEEAKHDWESGRIALPPDDDEEFIPLPHTTQPPRIEPMS